MIPTRTPRLAPSVSHRLTFSAPMIAPLPFAFEGVNENDVMKSPLDRARSTAAI